MTEHISLLNKYLALSEKYSDLADKYVEKSLSFDDLKSHAEDLKNLLVKRELEINEMRKERVQIGWYNKKYGSFFKLDELASTYRNEMLIANGELIRVYREQKL